MNQQEYEERMKDPKYVELNVTNCNSEKDYVFISYRGNSWKKVLTEIVYKLQKEYGLNVYFDKEFASKTNVWIEQFVENMDSPHCKAFLCFFDEGYVTSYATLLELMHAMNPQSKLKNSIYAITFPIDWEQLDKADYNTGLGVENLDNPAWPDEFTSFIYEFKLLKKEKDYKGIKAYFDAKANKTLKACNCKDIMAIIQPKNKRDYADNENFYKQFIVDPLKNTCPSVFDEISPTTSYKVKSDNETFNKTSIENSESNLWIYQAKGAKSYLEWDGESKTCIVKKGSMVATEAAGFGNLPAAKKMKDVLLESGVIRENRFVTDYTCDKISTMMNVLTGGSVSMPKCLKDGNLRKCTNTEANSVLTEAPKPAEPIAAQTVGDNNERACENMNGGVIAPIGLGGWTDGGEVKAKGTKVAKMSLMEMIQNGRVSVNDEVYVKGKENEIGLITSNGSILYNNQEFSLNKFVLEILGPGSRNAYIFVYHKATGKLLDELR